VDSKTRKTIIKNGDAFFKGLVNAGDSAAAGIQNGAFGGIKKSNKVREGHKPYLTMAEKEKARRSKKKAK